jgi:GT2 family glycosyltransferase
MISQKLKTDRKLPPLAAVIILNWNGWEDTIELMESLQQATYEPLFVIVIDNASTNNSVAHIEQWLLANSVSYSIEHADDIKPCLVNDKQHFLFVKSAVNLGFCAGNNLGMEWAVQSGAEYLLVLNNDTLVSPDFLQPMVSVAEQDPDVGLVGGVITRCDQPDTIWWAGGSFNKVLTATRLLDKQPLTALTAEHPLATEWISGCMMLIPARIYKQFGGYFEDYFIWSEEWDYSLTVSGAGYKLMVAPQARICHKVGHSLGVMKPLNYYYGTRNGLMFKRKFLSSAIWYPYLLYYLLNRAVRYTQLWAQGRKDLAVTGLLALRDYLTGRSGAWVL